MKWYWLKPLKHQWLKRGMLVLSALILCIHSALLAAEEGALKPITVQLKWKHQFQFAGYYAAVEKGFYREAGYDVTLKEANYDTDPIMEVIEGRADYGIANSELALYRLKGFPVKALAVIIQHSPIVLMTLKDANILSPQDLIGKRVMYPEGHYGANTLGIMLREGVAVDQFESVPLSFNLNDLVDRKVDAMVGYVTDQPYMLQHMGVEYNLLDPRVYGIDFYGDTLFTSEDRLDSNFDELERFRAATLAGWRYAMDHPVEIVDLLIEKYNSQKSRGELVYEAEETTKLIVPKLVEIGHMNEGRWQHIADTFIGLGMVGPKAELGDFLYEPDQFKNERLVERIFLSVAIGAAVVVIVLLALVVFNQRLRAMVRLKTEHLQDKNQALESSQAALLVKEDELSRFNKELESLVLERTKSLEEANQSLVNEVAYREEKEVSLELLHKAIANSRSAVMVVDHSQTINYVSDALCLFTGLSKRQLLDQSIDVLSGFIHLSTLFGGNLLRVTGFEVYREVRMEAAEDLHWLQISISPMNLGRSGISHYVVVCEDISELKQSKDNLERMALYDALTGLENRTLFNTRLEKAIERAKRSNVKTALLFVDLDQFKMINDNYGHDAGDQVLKSASERLNGAVRGNDSVARISGDEFTVLLADIHSYDDAGKVADHIVDAFSNPVIVDGREVFVTVSIGISIAPDDATETDQWIRNADVAMYQAKRNGRNHFQYFCQDMNNEIYHKRRIEDELKGAIGTGAFFLSYQPKLSLDSGRLVGVEALVRWRMDDKTIRMPDEFIGVAEETGTIVPLGYQILREAIEGFLWLREKGLESRVAVNISARQIKEHDCVANIRALFDAYPEVISYFDLEVTESAFIGSDEGNINRLKALRELGFSIAIDDFGKGYSSLSYLQKLPADTLKIDRSFVAELPHDLASVEISKTILALAKHMNLQVVAEGVETEAQASFLRENACDIAQGFLYGRPMSLKELVLAFSDQRTG